MSIDWLHDLERAIDNGRERFACPGVGRNQWMIRSNVDEVVKFAQRAANHKKMAVNVVRLISKDDAIAGDMFLVPTNIGEPATRGEPQIEWATVETKEAAQMMRDVRHGPSPFFGMQVDQQIDPVG